MLNNCKHIFPFLESSQVKVLQCVLAVMRWVDDDDDDDNDISLRATERPNIITSPEEETEEKTFKENRIFIEREKKIRKWLEKDLA